MKQAFSTKARSPSFPVPLYKTKRRQRGFNQAELIAAAALKAYPARDRLQLVPDLLLRTRDTHSQIGLTSHQRREPICAEPSRWRVPRKSLAARFFSWMMFTRRAPRRPNAPACCVAPEPARSGSRPWRAP